MTLQSFTGSINTQGEFASVETLTKLTFTQGTTYTMQILNGAYIKIADAVFYINNGEKFEFTAGTETLYIKNNYTPITLTILEKE